MCMWACVFLCVCGCVCVCVCVLGKLRRIIPWLANYSHLCHISTCSHSTYVKVIVWLCACVFVCMGVSCFLCVWSIMVTSCVWALCKVHFLPLLVGWIYISLFGTHTTVGILLVRLWAKFTALIEPKQPPYPTQKVVFKESLSFVQGLHLSLSSKSMWCLYMHCKYMHFPPFIPLCVWQTHS